ncbi:MAG: DUF4198 domain-containing protein [Gammaproteobacteria bacterium]|nr:DUF4198 domain-containing protein [Gammaproteobacteria bacterium]
MRFKLSSSPRESNRIRRLLSVVALWLPLSAAAHDFWIEPASFRPAVGSKVPLRLFVGMDFAGATTVYLPDTFERYIAVGPDGEKNILGILGDDPAGHLAVTRPGPYIVAYRSTLFTVTFDTLTEFKQYLEKEGLERIKTLRTFGPPKGKVIREDYSRSAKALVMVGKPGTSADRVLGLRLELVAEKNPYLAAQVPLRLIYEGKPLEGALVVAFNKTEPLKKLKARTDKDGRVQFDFNRPGVWLVTAVHMLPAPPKTNADWESVWASLTFERL